ncbi:MAG TPA: NADH-quinone oxidoreductase subunit J [Longimicrobiales bacterium]|nr:NADH-quinone oxidoreductase subunit J [Longimicrobiales bacterium]
MTELLWWVFASLAIGGALGMILGRSPVASLMFLILTFFGVAAIYILLGAHFIGAIQIIVYAGAIMVLFLFVIMLLNLGHDYEKDLRSVGWMAAGFAAAGATGFLLTRAFLPAGSVPDMGGDSMIAAAVEQYGAVGAVAYPMLQEYVVPFELTGLLLLIAIVGAVVLAKRRI